MNEIFGPLAAFWYAVLSHLWQTTLVLVPLLVLARGLRHAPARLTDAFWHIGLLKLFLPLSVFSGLAGGAVRFLADHLATSGAEATPTAVVAARAVLDPGHGLDLDRVAPGVAATVVVALLTVIWQLGAVRNLAVLARDLARARRRDGRPAGDLEGPEDVRLARILDDNGIPADRVLVAEHDRMPRVVGFLNPTIIVPRSLLSALSATELAAILRHEDAHRRRRDPLRSLLQRIALAVFWFFPPAHTILARLRESAEFACDEHALSAGIDPRRFTLAVARTVRLSLAPDPLAAAAGYGGRTLLEKRLSRIHRTGRSAMSRHRMILAAAAALVAAASFLPLPLLADADPPPPPDAAKAEAPAPPETVASPADAAVPGTPAAPELSTAPAGVAPAAVVPPAPAGAPVSAPVTGVAPEPASAPAPEAVPGSPMAVTTPAPPPAKVAPGETPPPPPKGVARDDGERTVQDDPQKSDQQKKDEEKKKKTRQEQEEKKAKGDKDPAQQKADELKKKQKHDEGEHLHQPPELLKLGTVAYPEAEAEAGVEGVVQVLAVLDEKGEVIETRIMKGIEGHPAMDKAAVKAVHGSTFAAATEDGHPVKSKIMVPVKFKRH